MFSEELIRERIADFLYGLASGLGTTNPANLNISLETKLLIATAFRSGYEQGVKDAQSLDLPDWIRQLQAKFGDIEPSGVERIFHEFEPDPRTRQTHIASTQITWRSRP